MNQYRAITRRTFLGRSMIGGAMLGVSAGGIAWLYRDDLRNLQSSEISSFLKSNFDYLKLDISDEQWAHFHADYIKHYGPIVRKHWQQWLKGRDSSYHQQKLDDLAVTFLMSTDFFLNGADEANTVKYVTLYHPYASPCWNPLFMAAAAEQA